MDSTSTAAALAELAEAQDALTAAHQQQTAAAQLTADAAAHITEAIVLLEGAPKPPEHVIPIGPGDDLLEATAAAPAGAVLALDPAYAAALGTVTIANPVTWATAEALEAERVTPDLVGPQLAGSLTWTGAGAALRGLRLEGIGSTAVTAGDGQTIDRSVILGPPGKPQQRGIAANAPGITIEGCHIGAIWKDVDTQAIWCFAKTKRLLVRDCYLEAAGENFMAGGADPATAEDIPRDLILEDCTFSKPIDWMDRAGCTVKNLLELKNAIGVTVRRCLLEYSWAHGQAGYAIVLAVRNQSGKAPFSTIEDVLIEDCTIAHVGAGISLLGRDDLQASQRMRGITFRRITIADMGKHWARGSALAAARAINISGGPAEVTFEDINANLQPGSMNAAIGFDQIQHTTEGLIVRRCQFYEGAYGITGQADGGIGRPQLEGHAPGYVWEDVTIQRGTSGRIIPYPPGTTILPPIAPLVYDGDPEGRDRDESRFDPDTRDLPARFCGRDR